MTLKNCAAFLYIFCHHIAAKRDNSGMTYNIIIINGYVSRSTTNIYKDNSCLFFIVCKNRIRRGQWLKNHILYCKICLPDTLFDVFSGGNLPDYDMKICLKSSAAHAYRALYPCFIINNEILGDNMNDLLTNVDVDLMHVINKPEDLLLLNLIIVRLTDNITAVFHTFYMLTGNTNKDLRK